VSKHIFFFFGQADFLKPNFFVARQGEGMADVCLVNICDKIASIFNNQLTYSRPKNIFSDSGAYKTVCLQGGSILELRRARSRPLSLSLFFGVLFSGSKISYGFLCPSPGLWCFSAHRPKPDAFSRSYQKKPRIISSSVIKYMIPIISRPANAPD
jgi:hypothetical protein